MADHHLRRVFVFHIVESVLTPEIRDPALRRDSCAPEEDDLLALIDILF